MTATPLSRRPRSCCRRWGRSASGIWVEWRAVACSCWRPTTVLKGKGRTHSRLPSIGFRSWSRFLAVSLQVTWVINQAVGCQYFPPGLQLPPQPLRGLLPIFSAWRTVNKGTMGVNSCLRLLPDSVATAIWTRAFCAWVQHDNRSATEPQSYSNAIVGNRHRHRIDKYRQRFLRQSYDYLTIIPKLRSTDDGRLDYKTWYEGRKAFLRYDSLAKL